MGNLERVFFNRRNWCFSMREKLSAIVNRQLSLDGTFQFDPPAQYPVGLFISVLILPHHRLLHIPPFA
jgi:hypothetical protein